VKKRPEARGKIQMGREPTFSAFSRPSEPWGRSRPPRAARGRVLSTFSRGAKSLSDTESDNL